MVEHFWLGMTIALMGGVVTGSFAVPMKYLRRWHWENMWLVFSFVCLEFLPWVLAFAFVPKLGEVFRGVPASALLYPLGFGLIWGVSLVTYGIAIKMVGMALTGAVVTGLSCLIGSLTPLVVLHPGELLHPRGLLLLLSMPNSFSGPSPLSESRAEKRERTSWAWLYQRGHGEKSRYRISSLHLYGADRLNH